MKTTSPFKKRTYLHFDEPIGEKKARAIATNPSIVESWGFLPMLRCDLKVDKVKRLPENRCEPSEKVRPICYSAHHDAAIYSYYAKILSDLYETEVVRSGISDVVTAFRANAGECNIHAAKEVFHCIRERGSCLVLAFDIQAFFDTLDHGHLKRQWAALLEKPVLPGDHYAVFKSITRFCWVSRDAVLGALGLSRHNPRRDKRRRFCEPGEFRSRIRPLIKVNGTKGIPQGSPISAVLSNIYMLEFDRAVRAKISSIGGVYRRYCDDMLCVIPTEMEREIESFVLAAIAKLKLNVQDKKTTRHHFAISSGSLCVDRELQYLGFVFNGKRVLLRNAGLGRYYSRMRSGVRIAAAMRSKSVSQASSDSSSDQIRRKKLNIRYSYLGGRNYVSYALRAARIMEEPAIRRQIRRHWGKLNAYVLRRERKREG